MMGGVGAVMALVLVGCIGVMTHRRAAKRRAQEAWRSKPGCRPEMPLKVARFDEMDDFVHAQRCHCGGSCVLRSEGSLSAGAVAMRVVRGECDRCEEEMSFFFELPEIEH